MRTFSPLRYPGGKTQLAKFVNNLLEINDLKNIIYIEPFAGGFGAGLELLFNSQVSQAVINDYDIAIYSIWYAILNESERFADDVQNINITIAEWERQKEVYNELIEKDVYSYELAFATYFLNRTNISGIITGGPIGGRDQMGKYELDCRFNQKNLPKKIMEISKNRNKIKLFNLEANDFIEKVILNYSPEEIFVFFDPPYYEQGKNLYTDFFEPENHVALKQTIDFLKDYYWILTYDNQVEISQIYEDYNQCLYEINYSANKVRKASELLIHSNRIIVESYDKVQIKDVNVGI